MNLLSVEDIIVGYGKAIVLHQIQLHVEKGAIVALLGSNGSGKTTLIRTIMGVVKPLQGKIEFDGREIQQLEPHRMNEIGISIAPEGRKIFPEMTVLENLRMGCYRETRKEIIRERMEEVFRLFPRLKERTSQQGGTLSGGEQEMLSLGRALMANPRLLILDEPSLGLQPNLVQKMFEMIQQIRRERGTTILLAEQNARKTLEIADSGYVLQRGRIIASGPAEAIAENEVVKRAYLKADRT